MPRRRTTLPMTFDPAQEDLLPNVPPGMRWTDMPMEALAQIDLGAIAPTAAFITSVRRFGVVQPIIVRELNAAGMGQYTIVDGRRRLAAARNIGLTHVPALIINTSVNAASAMTIVANTHRSSNPRAEYDAIDELVRSGLSTEQIAERLALPRARIERRYVIATLNRDLLRLYQEGHISHNCAIAATRLDAESQVRAYQLYASSGTLTVHDVTRALDMQSRAQRALQLNDVPVQSIVDQVAALSNRDLQRFRSMVADRVNLTTETQVQSYEAQIHNLTRMLRVAQDNERLRTEERNEQMRQVRELTRAAQVREQEFGENQPLTPAQARDAVQRFLVTRVQFPGGTTLRGRLHRVGGRWEYQLDVVADEAGVGFERMMRAVRNMGAPQRNVLRERILQTLGGPPPPGDWHDAVLGLQNALIRIPMEDANADAAYQHITAALLEIARLAGVTVER